MSDVVLVTTLHDPEGRMVDATSRLVSRLLELYGSVSAAPTPWTSSRLLDTLSRSGVVVEPRDKSAGAIGAGRRHALQMGLRTGATHLHYCDFDRILHWIVEYPEELPLIGEQIRLHDYLIIGRSERAFSTHPRVQLDTEEITNHAFSLWLGQQVDVTAGSCGVSRRAAELLLEGSTSPTNATDTEWPALVWKAGMKLGFVRTEGLEFETPDYFADQVAAAGSLDAWMEERSRPLEAWVARTRLTLESLQALKRVIGE